MPRQAGVPHARIALHNRALRIGKGGGEGVVFKKYGCANMRLKLEEGCKDVFVSAMPPFKIPQPPSLPLHPPHPPLFSHSLRSPSFPPNLPSTMFLPLSICLYPCVWLICCCRWLQRASHLIQLRSLSLPYSRMHFPPPSSVPNVDRLEVGQGRQPR